MATNRSKKFILWFNELGIKDVPLVGGKNASLGEMYRNLSKSGINFANGYAVSAYSYFYLLEKAKIKKKIKEALSGLNTHDVQNLAERGKKVREIILNAELPNDLETEIVKAYKKLESEYGKNVDVAVRSSATAEDLPDASFAGQQETYLNIRGEKALLHACRKCFASLFTNRAISYRQDKGFGHFKVGLSIGVQKMVRTDLASSGVMFSIDTETGFKNAVLIDGSWGLGENVVQGKVNPDEWYVFKNTLEQDYKPIISKKLGTKKIKMIYAKGKNSTKDIPTTKTERQTYCLSDKEILTLAKWAVIIENHYKKPMDMEWAKDGQTNKLYIVQARPETIHTAKVIAVLEEYRLLEKGKKLVSGVPVGQKIGAGIAHIIRNSSNIKDFKPGEVLVTNMTDPDWEPIMKIAQAIVTNQGGRTCHAAIVSRELGIPCIVGCGDATQKIKTGNKVTVSCAEGDSGHVYNGILEFKIKKTNLKNLKRPKTNIMMNIGAPDIAFQSSFIPNDGVGLARLEFIINNHIQVHPLALLNFSKLKDHSAKQKIAKLTVGYTNKAQYFVDKLAEGIGQIGAAFYPGDVIVRMSDFKSNEYAGLIGGKQFEPVEENPMIGWRGASRYYSEKYKPAFALECKAMKKAREVFGLKNIKAMVPFCRTVEEGKAVLKVMKENGLQRKKDGLEIYVMVEIPSNVILADEFAKIFDGFSIGSNDLTQLILGLDRDSALVSHVYDERNAAVKKLVADAIAAAKKNKIKIGICGQAPSDFPDFTAFLVEQGIDSVSITPDTVVKTTLQVLNKEKQMKGRRKK
ncbi:phosphoenolpyruvate synthase [Patescibacteria group bacterium]|nr:phosphoenolpyruvate synthase [Patescibacteria group bacterium]